MKKAITILAVLIVLVSAVFASETHTITVRADVDEVLPAFNLNFGALDTNESSADIYGKTNPVVDYDETSHTENGSADVGFTLDVANSFTVTAQVINNVKTNKSFTIQFKGGVFGVKRNGTPDLYYSPSRITVADVHTTDAVKATTQGVTGLTNSTTNNDSTADTTNTLIASGTVNFSGKTGTGATSALDIIEATFTYPGDNTIDPTLNSDHYYADVVMIVTQP